MIEALAVPFKLQRQAAIEMERKYLEMLSFAASIFAITWFSVSRKMYKRVLFANETSFV